MYRYVEDKKFLKCAQRCCSKMMHELEEELRDVGINSQFFLVGSGGRNMITQNANEPIDFDYNLNILDCDDFSDCRYIKNEVMKAMNQVMKNNGLDDVEDSTSAISTKPIYFTDTPDIEFSMDICIVTVGDKGHWLRLIHKKGIDSYHDRYYWNEAPNSSQYKDKSKMIKTIPEAWNKVKDRYLEIKNFYLRKNDHNHPSFVCFIEAVNEVYNEMRSKRII